MSPDGSPQEQESWHKRFEMSLAEIVMELPEGHRAKNEFEYLISTPRGELTSINSRIEELQRNVRELQEAMMPDKPAPQPSPQPQSLVEAVEDLLRSPTFCEDWPLMHEKLSGCVRRGKRIAEKREKVIEQVRIALIAAITDGWLKQTTQLMRELDEECGK